MSIIVDQVTKTYEGQKALDNVSFEVKRGEVLGFLGPNGAGKSTMMKIISCFISPTTGKVMVEGLDVLEYSMEVRELVGYLPESNPLYYDMYVKEYLQFVCGIYGIKSNQKKRIEEMVELTGLGLEQHKQIGQLSKGFKQRVGIAQAIIHDPKILILDEPTSGLDPNQLVDIRELIKTLGQDKTVMFSSHIMQEVEAVSDRVIIIDKGQLVTDNNVKEMGDSIDLAILVEFDTAVEVEKLSGISGIKQVESLGNKSYRLVGQSDNELRKVISLWAQSNGILVLTLKIEGENLESFFRKHTS
jgi:ABC-2 type transport system ATP-binding protein